MARSHHYRATSKEPPELDITTFLNLMVVLVPFLLITAVFSRITIMELNLPTGAGKASDKPAISVEVIIRKKGLEISNGRSVILSIPKKGEKYDLNTLSAQLQNIKKNYPDKKDATILLEGDIPSPMNPPNGCHFHPRCWNATDKCRETYPEVVDQTATHQYKCHNPITLS